MIITCDNCNTSFKLGDDLVKEGGTKVKCTKCAHVFVAHPEAQIEEFDVIELSDPDMELEMEEVSTPKEKPQTDEEFDLNFEIDDDNESDMLDLSDLEKMLEMEPPPGNEAADEGDEPELELELEMESESEDEEIVLTDEAEDLDLTDLEEMLELDESEVRDNGTEEDPEFELELELEADADISPPEKSAPVEDELDLSDIEKLLEMDDIKSPEPQEDEEDLHLELELDIVDEAVDEELTLDMDTEVPDSGLEDAGGLTLDDEDLDAFALEMEEDDSPEIAIESSAALLDEDEGDIDLDFDIEISEPDEEADISISEVDEDEEESDSVGFGMGNEEKVEARPAKPATPAFATMLPVPKKKSKMPVILVVLLMLIGGVAGGYYYLNQQGMLPFLRKSGEILPLDETFKHYFVENQNVGSLFVITGFVENKFNTARSNIRVTGELLTDKAKVAQTQTVYCGNVLSEMELTSSGIEKIKQKLENAAGEKQSNINVGPGSKLPFMIVFPNYPPDLAEYRIQIAGSLPVEK